jgi:hypothetical protein
MPRRHLVTSALLGLSVALVAASSVPLSASAATGNITITSAGPTGGDPTVLTVVANDKNGLQLSSMTVHLTSGTTTYPVTTMAYVSGTPDAQTWTNASSPIPPGAVPPGTYAMTVDATDSSPETDNGLSTPNQLAYLYTTTITVKKSTAISYGNRSSTISGTLTGVAPGTPAPKPVDLGSVPVALYDMTTKTLPQQIANTAFDGSYQGTATLDPADTYQVQVAASPSMEAASSPVTVTVTPDATRLQSVKVTPTDLKYGQKATMTGTAQYEKAKNTWVALSGAAIQPSAGTTQLPTVKTNSKGQFSSPIPSTDGSSWGVSVGQGSPFFVPNSVSGRMNVALPLKVRSFTATLSSFGYIDTTGCLQVAVANYKAPGNGRVNIQYSKGSRGPWKTLGSATMHTAGSSSCGSSSEAYFKATIPARLANAYYRADYPGSVSFQPVVTKAVHAWKYVTEISPLHVSPLSVARGGKITVSGRLRQYIRSWRNFSRQQILIILKPRHSKIWYWIYKVTTNSKGYFSKTFVDPESATWSAEYVGDKTHLAGGGAEYYVSVR